MMTSLFSHNGRNQNGRQNKNETLNYDKMIYNNDNNSK